VSKLTQTVRTGARDATEARPYISCAAVAVTLRQGPFVGDDAVSFVVRERRFTSVALLHELRRPRRIEFGRVGATFSLTFPRPDADRFEYLLETTGRGGTRVAPDPTNPLRARGPFGEKSVVEFPEYETPAWVRDDEAPPGALRELPLRSRRLAATFAALLWSPPDDDPTRPLPLLVVHDGPEYADYSSLTRLLDHLVSFGETPDFRALLLPPGPARDELYSASTRYADALASELLPAALEHAPSELPPVLLGASLGALAALHAHVRHPDLASGLFLQSGSFFRPRFDAHEARFSRFSRIVRFVGRVHGRLPLGPAVPTVVTCGTAEENLDNNRALAAALEGRGWPVKTVWNRDAHNWTAWRDALHPHLAELLTSVWS
jgi:enterochelin esterase family protein